MWERLAAFWRGFSKQLCKSALFADFHRCGISIKPVICSGNRKLIFASFLRVAGFRTDGRQKRAFIAS